jgi:uncharacterized protein (DUF2336 family)
MVPPVQAQRSLIAEIEGAIASGSSEKRVDTLRRVTDLFLVSAESFSDDQVGVFDDVITRLAERIETKARAELASRLAPVKNAPIEVVRKLARDQSFEVAGPVLTQSNRLTEQDLLACAESNSQERLLAISKRATISEAVSDALVTRGDREVVRSVARNEGARFSDSGFVKLVEKSEADEELAVSVGSRQDIPKEHFQALVAKASEAVFKRLSASNPAAAAEVKRVLQVVTGRSADAKIVRDYTQAKAAVEAMLRAGQQVDPGVHNFAKGKQFEETVVALAALCRLPIDVVERALMDKGADHDLTLILSKAAGLTWPTAKLIMLLRAGEGGVSPHVMEEMHHNFERLQLATAQRVVRFYQVRHSKGEKP